MVVMLIYKISACRPYKDFGRGFYLTDIPEQAERMAERVARIYGGEPVLNIYEIDDSFLDSSSLRIKNFGEETTEDLILELETVQMRHTRALFGNLFL